MLSLRQEVSTGSHPYKRVTHNDCGGSQLCPQYMATSGQNIWLRLTAQVETETSIRTVQ
jgi:hypothetical protein